jgi:uncharacterized RDD family membrane protein YckC
VFCSKCGATLAADIAFCQTCGTPVGRAGLPGAVSPHAGVGAIAYASNVTYAGFWLRFVAYLVDSLILGFATLALFIPFFFMMGGVAFLESLAKHPGGRPEPGMIAALLSLVFTLIGVAVLVKWLYFAFLESGENQATWGKQLLGVYVTDLSGNRITFGRASGRFFAKIISGLIPLWIGFIMAGFTERKQALHDMIASCLVLRR